LGFFVGIISKDKSPTPSPPFNSGEDTLSVIKGFTITEGNL